MNFQDFVWFWLAEKDGMADTSLLYWLRCMDLDGDGLLNVDDMTTCYSGKVSDVPFYLTSLLVNTSLAQ